MNSNLLSMATLRLILFHHAPNPFGYNTKIDNAKLGAGSGDQGLGLMPEYAVKSYFKSLRQLSSR